MPLNLHTRIAPLLLLVLGSCSGISAPHPAPSTPITPPAGTAVGAQPAATALTLDAELPLDPELVAGRLDNGLRYIIRANVKPEDRAEIWLAVDVGSLLEDDDQLGLAHFVEHMAFNGTRHFEKQELVDYLERIGMQFGPDVNAFTSFDETVYMLRVPTDDEEILRQAFQILEDWAHGITFDGEEIDKERGVVVEEWRLGRGAEARIRDQQFPILFRDSRYAERLPIGSREILENAPHEALRRFYREWYRPDLMAVIAVGDFDASWVEQRIREHFSALEKPAESRPRPVYPVPDHGETLYGLITDPEATATSVGIYYKLEKRPETRVGDYRRQLAEQLYHGMLNARLDELRREPEPPFLGAFSTSAPFVRSRDVFLQLARVPEGGVERGLEALLTEIERIDRHGFTSGELKRIKADVRRSYEQAYRERDKRESSSYASEYLRHLLGGEPVPGIGTELELVDELLPGIGLEELNRLAESWITEPNRVILVSGPEKEGSPLPSVERIETLFETVEAGEIEPWVDRVREQPLISRAPAPGRVIEETRIPEIGVTVWHLSNGVRVLLKPTDFRNDEVLLVGFSPGGHSLASDEDYPSARFADAIASAGGVGEFGLTELEKALAGKFVTLSPFISELEEGVRGSASPEDLETLFQLLYLNFTDPRWDEAAFQSLIARWRATLENRRARPEAVFGDELTLALYQGHPRRLPPSVEMLDDVGLDTALEVYRERFADAGDFTLVLVGNFEPEAIRPLVEIYAGGLPSTARRESWRDVGAETPEEPVELEVRTGLEPKSQVRLVFNGAAEWSRQGAHELRSLAEALRIRLREVLREDMGATYGVGVSASLDFRPRERYSLTISFGCAPENVEGLVGTLLAELERAREQGLEERYAEKVRETQLRQRETDLEENGFWLQALRLYATLDLDPRLILQFDELVEQVTAAGLRSTARRYLDPSRYVLAVLYPEGSAGEPGAEGGGTRSDGKVARARDRFPDPILSRSTLAVQ